MIATLVFSLILVVITVGVLSFTNSYYKGITSSKTQDVARQVMSQVSQAIQFSGTDVTVPIGSNGSSQGFCLGSTRYSYTLGRQLVDSSPDSHQTKHALVRDNPGQCSAMKAQDLSNTHVDGTELLSPNMRLANLQVKPVSGAKHMYHVAIRVVYGDSDLLTHPYGKNANCKFGVAGSRFCAASELSATVEQRVQ
jgi:type II secretory pathway pseudopilin PulG